MAISSALITGINGLAGRHLARALQQRGVAVRGFSLPTADSEFAAVTDHGSVTDAQSMAAAMADHPPDTVFHLAALAAPGNAWQQRREVFEVNALGTGACLEAVATAAPGARVVLVSSGLVYGNVAAADQPVNEDHPLRPAGPYAVSKACAEMIALEFSASHDIDLVIVRPFNFTGPGQATGFVSADFASQIARIEAGIAPAQIHVGNLEAERDFTDVRDFVTGIIAAAEQGTSGTAYNLCSGRAVAIQTVLDTLLAASSAEIAVLRDPSRLRPADVPRFIGDNRRALGALGWQPRIPLEQTLRETLDWWRMRVEVEGAANA
jgi:GDP-4-dehydro-6-deoxy-D-mannose reductase